MTDQATDAAVEGRLRDFLTAELRQAELDYPHLVLPTTTRYRPRRVLALATLVAAIAVAVLLGPLVGPPSTITGGDPLGADGVPKSIGGEPVLRGPAIDARLSSDPGGPAFLAGGYLVLRSASCPSAAPAASGGCGEEWRLADAPAADPTSSYPLLIRDIGGPTLVQTSGAPTVFRVKDTIALFLPYGSVIDGQPQVLRVEAVAWRQPTKGRIPTEATPPEGGAINMALVPDFVSVWDSTGEAIAGYAPKGLLLTPLPLVGGSPGHPPPEIPVPVYGEDLTTLVGHMVAGHGFVASGSAPLPSGEALGLPSVAPSPSGASASFPIAGCDRLQFSAIRCGAVVTRAREQAVPQLRAEDVTAATVTIAPPDHLSLGSDPIAVVQFDLVDAGTAQVVVRCLGLSSDSDRACNADAAITVRGGIDRDVPCSGEAPQHPCATPPPSPRPAAVNAAVPLRQAILDVPLDHVGHYEILIGTASLPDGVMTERSASLADPRPSTFWIDQGVALDVRSDIGGRPPIGSIYREPYDGPEPVHVYLVFDVVEFQPGAVLQVRDLVVR